MEKWKLWNVNIYHINANKNEAMVAILISKLVNRIQGKNQ